MPNDIGGNRLQKVIDISPARRVGLVQNFANRRAKLLQNRVEHSWSQNDVNFRRIWPVEVARHLIEKAPPKVEVRTAYRRFEIDMKAHRAQV